MESKHYLLAILVVAIIAVGLLSMPALSEQVYAGSINSDLKNKGQQGDLKSDGKRQGQGGSNCPKCDDEDSGGGATGELLA